MDISLLMNALGNMHKFMGLKLTTIEESKELTRIFRSLDAIAAQVQTPHRSLMPVLLLSSDGQLNRQELIEGYKKLMLLMLKIKV